MVGHGDDALNDGSIIAAVGQLVNETAVDFHRTDGQMLQITQARVAGAKVIDGDADLHTAKGM